VLAPVLDRAQYLLSGSFGVGIGRVNSVNRREMSQAFRILNWKGVIHPIYCVSRRQFCEKHISVRH
jgi:hypothetical protein